MAGRVPGSPVADVQSSLGAALVGLLVSTMLWGMTIMQTCVYFWHYRNRDPMALKLFISFITIVNALNTILCACAIYWYLVLNFGDVESLDYIMWALKLQDISGVVISASVQSYYARRVYIVSQSIICLVLVLALVAIAFSLGLFFTIEQFALERFSKLHSLLWNPCIVLAAITVADLLIAGAICWSLYRKRTGLARTDSIIMTLIAYSINSGLLTSVLATAAIISFVASPSSMIWQAIIWTMGQCGINSLLAMLNSRDYLLGRPSSFASIDQQDNAFNMSSIRIAPPSETYMSKSGQTGVFVTVHHSTASGFVRSKSDHNIGPIFEVPKAPESDVRTEHMDYVFAR